MTNTILLPVVAPPLRVRDPARLAGKHLRNIAEENRRYPPPGPHQIVMSHQSLMMAAAYLLASQAESERDEFQRLMMAALAEYSVIDAERLALRIARARGWL